MIGLLHGRVGGHISTLASPLGAQILLGLVAGLGVAVDTLFIDGKAIVLGDLLPGFQLAVDAVDLLLELVVGGAELRDGLLGEKLLQCPLLDRLLFVLLELGNVADSICQDRTLVLLAPRNNLS